MKIKDKKRLMWLMGFYVGSLLLVAFLDIIVNHGSILIYPGDSYDQMYQFYLGGWIRYKELSLTGWEWSLGLGGSIFSYVYYFATSPFFLLSLLLSRDMLKYTFLYFNLLKMFCLFFASYYWLNKIVKIEISKIVGALMIVFSGWVFFYLNYNCFLDAFAFYPLILAFTEDYLQNHKKLALVIGIGFLGIVNYYFLYMFIPFLWMYALYRYVVIHQGNGLSLKSIVFEALKFIGYSFLGIGISAVVLLPCADLILGNQRFSSIELSHVFLGKKDILKILSSLFIPVTARFNSNVLIDVTNHNSLGWGGGSSIYSLLLTPILLSSFLVSKNTFKKYAFLVFYSLIAVMMCMFPFYKLFQMTIDSRWFYMILFLNSMGVAEVIEMNYSGLLTKNQLRFGAFTSMSMYVALVAVARMLGVTQSTEWTKILTISSFIFLILYFLWIEFAKKKTILLLAIVGMECIWCGWVYNENNIPISASFFDNDEFSMTAIETIKELEPEDGFYRILYGATKEHYEWIENAEQLYLESDQSTSKDEFINNLKSLYLMNYDLFTPNDPFAKNYAGVSFYNTIYSTGAEGFLKHFKSGWAMVQNKQRIESMNLVGTKYWFSHYKSLQPPYGYELITEKDGIYIYENTHFINLGFGYKETLSESEVVNKDILQQDMVFLEVLVSSNSNQTLEDVNYSSPLTKVGIYPTGSVHAIEFDEAIEDQIFYIMNFGLDNLKVRLYHNDELVFEDRYVQFHYVDFPITKEMNVNRIEFECYDTYGYGEGNNDIYVYCRNLNDYERWYDDISNRMFENVHMSDDRIDAEIEIEEGYEHVFTSVPYDKGWKVFVDGEEIEYYRVQLGLIGFDLEAGKHSVTFVYETPYLKIGAVISCISLLSAIYICRKKKTKM